MTHLPDTPGMDPIARRVLIAQLEQARARRLEPTPIYDALRRRQQPFPLAG